MAPVTRVHSISVAVSLAVHAAAFGAITWAALWALDGRGHEAERAELPEPGGVSGSIDVDVASERQGESHADPTRTPSREVPRPEGGQLLARLDTGAFGRGGDRSVARPALNLADGDERLHLTPELLDRIDRDQLQRLRVARTRASWEDRRSTTHPMELTLVVSGPGSLLERRPPADTLPSRGALASPPSQAAGATLGAPVPTSQGAGPRNGAAHEGAAVGAPGVGVATARQGEDRRASAPVASARPNVAQAPVAVPANEPARPRDDVESEQEVATSGRSIVHASTAGGEPGDGQGGTGGGGDPGAGGPNGAGSRARPLGVGESDVLDYWTSDPRIVAYFLLVHAKIDPLWANAFPRSALLELKQGTVILEFTIAADGQVTVSWPPARPSGIDEFDRNCADAIRHAGPFPPIPASLGVRFLHIRAPFAALNPIVK